MIRTVEARATHYRLGPDDRIIEVSGDWEGFAARNGAPAIAGDAVLGHPIWDFISDPETREIYRSIFGRARAQRISPTLPFRCDAPDRRRWIELTISSPDGGILDLTARVVREEARPLVRLMSPTEPRSERRVVMCSWCKRVRLPDAGWVDVEEAVSSLDLFDAELLPVITHGICPQCAERFDPGPGRPAESPNHA